MVQPVFKAPKPENAIQSQKLHRDVRTTFQQIVDSFKSPIIFGGTIFILGIIPVFVPALTLFVFLLAWPIYHLRMRSMKKEHLPFRMPYTSMMTDYGDPTPGRRGFSKASGVFLLGNTFGEHAQELWLGIRDMLTHMLIFGTTGSGKTETLVSLAFNAIAMGSGLFYVDPKGSPKLIAQLYVMARICGRDDDFRCINYLIAEKSAAGVKMPLRTTNMINPFSYGNAESLSNMLNSLIPKAEGNNAIFNANARNLMKSVMYALVEMRDKGEIHLSAKTIRDYLTLTKVMTLAERNDFSRNTTDALRAFLTSVGWQEGKDEKGQPKSLAEQFGYARSYFGDPLNNLTDTYGHIYATPFGEIDMRDVVMNRRILAIIIPSLAMAQEEVKSLGVISLSAIRIAISVGLGSGKEGTFADILYSLPTDAPAPFLSITDEYAAIPTPGYVEVLTQGRGLGISAIVASQDFPGIEKADKEGSQQLLENTKVKVFMKGTVAGSTFDVAKGLAGEVSLMETSGYGIKPDSSSMFMDYRDSLNTNVKERSKILLSDIQDQIEGEYHAFLGSTMVRGMTFYANPPLPADYQIQYNHMVSIYPPDVKDIEIRFGGTAKIVEFLNNRYDQLPSIDNSLSEKEKIAAREVEVIKQFEERSTGFESDADDFNAIFKETISKPLASPMDTVIAAFVRFHNRRLGRENPLENKLDDIISKADVDNEADKAGGGETVIGDMAIDDLDDDAFIFMGQDDLDDEEAEEEKIIQPRTESISEIIKLRNISKNPNAHETEIQDHQLESEVLGIEAIITTDIHKARSKARSTANSIKKIQSEIMDAHPTKPVPPNDPKTKNILSNRLNEMIKNATVNKK